MHPSREPRARHSAYEACARWGDPCPQPASRPADTNREPDLSVAAVRRERVRLTANIRATRISRNVLRRQLREREPEHGEVILSRVRAGVPWSKDRGERLAGLVQPAAERMKPVPMLVVVGRQL